MAEHKHAAVLRAIADGKAVERSANGVYWAETTDEELASGVNPIKNPDYQWRIKPEPKPDVRRWGVASVSGPSAIVKHLGDANFRSDNNICLVFDGETGKLKSAEVLP